MDWLNKKAESNSCSIYCLRIVCVAYVNFRQSSEHRLFVCFRNGHALTHSLKKPFECPMPTCGRSYCDARSLRRHIDNYHARPLSAVAATVAASVDGGITAQEFSSTREHLNSLSSVSDDDESRQLAHLAAYESVVL